MARLPDIVISLNGQPNAGGTDTRRTKPNAHFVGAGSPANTGEAGAMLRAVFFAGKPAPTGISRDSRY